MIAGMTQEIFTGLILFAFATSITPGPNNLMLLASGANFGWRRTLPHMAGVALGFGVMAVVLGAGLVQVFDAFPASYTVLQVLCVIYMVWLAWKIANAAAPTAGAEAGRPITFLQACAFLWVNPKAWAMALTALTNYAPGHGLPAVLFVASVFTAVNFPSVGCWALLGERMRGLLANPKRLRAFNILMAILLLASLWPVLRSGGIIPQG